MKQFLILCFGIAIGLTLAWTVMIPLAPNGGAAQHLRPYICQPVQK